MKYTISKQWARDENKNKFPREGKYTIVPNDDDSMTVILLAKDGKIMKFIIK